VGLENQLLEAKSSQLRADKAAAAAAAATAKLEAQLAKLTQRSDESSAELAGLTSERRILKARLMQAEARLRAAGLEPLPPLPQGRGGATSERLQLTNMTSILAGRQAGQQGPGSTKSTKGIHHP
jgi:hypothetical protein